MYTALIAQRFPKVVIPLLNEAKESIKIIVYDWRFYNTQPSHAVSLFNMAIARACGRGVSVRALVSSDTVIENLKKIRCEAKRVHSKKLLHTKMLLIDDKLVIIGSHNYTQNAFSLNHEASILVELENNENDFTKYFNALWGV